MRRSVGRYSSFAHSSHGVCFALVFGTRVLIAPFSCTLHNYRNTLDNPVTLMSDNPDRNIKNKENSVHSWTTYIKGHMWFRSKRTFRLSWGQLERLNIRKKLSRLASARWRRLWISASDRGKNCCSDEFLKFNFISTIYIIKFSTHLFSKFLSFSVIFRAPLWSSGQSSWLQNKDALFPVRYELNLYMVCRRPPLWSSGQSSWLQNGDLLCFLWGTNWIYICFVQESRPPLWSSGQSSWLHNRDILCFLWGTHKSDCSGKARSNCIVNYRTVLSLERAPQNDNPATV
jgi:hypothetical protein